MPFLYIFYFRSFASTLCRWIQKSWMKNKFSSLNLNSYADLGCEHSTTHHSPQSVSCAADWGRKFFFHSLHFASPFLLTFNFLFHFTFLSMLIRRETHTPLHCRDSLSLLNMKINSKGNGIHKFSYTAFGQSPRNFNEAIISAWLLTRITNAWIFIVFLFVCG